MLTQWSKMQWHLQVLREGLVVQLLRCPTKACVYYLYAWFRLPKEQRNNVEFVVPTGNFGNVLAGWLAQKMGLPVSSFKVATNQNDISASPTNRAKQGC